MVDDAECHSVPLSSSFVEICKSLLRNDPIATDEFYAWENSIFWSIWGRKRRLAWLSCKWIFTVFTLASFLFSQGLCCFGRLSLTQRSVTAAHCTWAADVSSLRARMVVVPFYRLYHLDRCGFIAGREFDKHTCGQDHLFLLTHTFLQLAVSGINELQILLWQMFEFFLGYIKTNAVLVFVLPNTYLLFWGH